MHRRSASLPTLLALMTPLVFAPLANARGEVTSDPPNAPIHLVLENGADLVDRVLGSSLYEHLSKEPLFLAAQNRPETKKGLVGLRFLAGALKTDLPGMLRLALGRRVDLYATPGEDGGTGSVVLAIDLGDAARAHEAFEVFDQTLTLIGAADGDAIDTDGIRSVNGQEFHAECGSSIVLGNDRASVEALMRSLADGGGSATDPMTSAPPRFTFELDLAAIREQVDSNPLPEVHDNGIGAMLFHGLFIAINRASRVSGAVTFADDRISLAANLDHPSLDDPELGWYLAPSGTVSPEIWPEGTIATLRIDRKLAAFYQSRHRWLAEASENDFVQFDQALSLFFGGRSFGEEILPSFGDGILAVISPQRFESLGATPSPCLPALTLVTPVAPGKLKDRDLAMFFQNSLAIVNLERAQHGQDSLFVRSEKKFGATVHSARFELPEVEAGQDAPLPEVRFNLSPTLTSAHGQFILGTGEDGVEATLEALKSVSEKAKSAQPAGTGLKIDIEAVATALDANRETLIANRMLDEGEDHETAAHAIDLFMLGLRTLKRLDLGLGLERGHFALVGDLRFADFAQR